MNWPSGFIKDRYDFNNLEQCLSGLLYSAIKLEDENVDTSLLSTAVSSLFTNHLKTRFEHARNAYRKKYGEDPPKITLVKRPIADAEQFLTEGNDDELNEQHPSTSNADNND
nr:protein C13B9.1 [imported] - Caenorhabditis elegans [Caenorhabditis elegans]